MTESVVNTPQNPVTIQSIDSNGDVVTDSSGNPAGNVKDADGPGGLIAGERNIDSAENGYLVTCPEVNKTVNDPAATPALTVESAKSYLFGVYQSVDNSHTYTISDGATTIFTVPVGAGTGLVLDFGGLGLKFDTSIVFAWNASETGTATTVLHRTY